MIMIPSKLTTQLTSRVAQPLCILSSGVMFYQAVTQFKDTFQQGSDDSRRREADVVYHTFLHGDAIMEVNVASGAEKKVKSICNNCDIPIPKTLFDNALAEVLGVMERDNYPRFKKSAIARHACLNATKTTSQTKSVEDSNQSATDFLTITSELTEGLHEDEQEPVAIF